MMSRMTSMLALPADPEMPSSRTVWVGTGAVELQQTDGLAGSGEGDTGRVGGAEVLADEIAARAAAGDLERNGGERLGLERLGAERLSVERLAIQRHGLGRREVVQAADVEGLDAGGDRGLAVGGVELAAGGVAVGVDLEVEGVLHVGDGSRDAEDGAVGMGAGDGEAVLLGELDDGLVILLGGAELIGELGWSEEVLEVRAGRVGDLSEESVQFLRIAERDADG
jgi:hypothetical protein